MDCKKRSGTCDVASCNELKNKECFDKNIFDHARKHDRALVCLECQSKGFSPKELKSYTCGVCGDLGHLKFDPQSLRNYKTRSDKLLCKICKGKNTRLKQTLKCTLAKPNAWKCTCPGGSIHKANRVLNEKCGLYPSRAGEKRWPGGNVCFDEEDWLFREQAYKYRKNR